METIETNKIIENAENKYQYSLDIYSETTGNLRSMSIILMSDVINLIEGGL